MANDNDSLLVAVSYTKRADSIYAYAEGYEGGGEWSEAAIKLVYDCDVVVSIHRAWDIGSNLVWSDDLSALNNTDIKIFNSLSFNVKEWLEYDDNDGITLIAKNKRSILENGAFRTNGVRNNILADLSKEWQFHVQF